MQIIGISSNPKKFHRIWLACGVTEVGLISEKGKSKLDQASLWLSRVGRRTGPHLILRINCWWHYLLCGPCGTGHSAYTGLRSFVIAVSGYDPSERRCPVLSPRTSLRIFIPTNPAITAFRWRLMYVLSYGRAANLNKSNVI